MASPAPWGWPWKKSSTPRVYSSYLIKSSSTTFFNSSSSFSVYPFIFTHAEQSTLSSLSFRHQHRHQKSPIETHCSLRTRNTETRLRKSGKQLQIGENSVSDVGSSRTKQQFLEKSKNLSYDFSGRRELWRRIRFASKKFRNILLLNVITIIYASNIPVLKEVEAVMDPAAFTVVRFAIASIPFLPFVIRARGDIFTRNSGIELGLWVSLGYLMQALALQTADAGRTSFFCMFTVIVVPLIDGMLGAVIPARTWFGALLSIIGVGLLESSGSPPCVGDLLSFLSAVFFGIHMLRTEHITRKTDKENLLPILGYEVCVVAISSAIWYFVGCWLNGSQEVNPSTWRWTMLSDWMMEFPWIPALYTGIFSTGLCLWVEIAAMRNVSATETAIIYGLEPVWGALFAWFILGERWGTAGWIGAALVLGGSLTVQIFGASHPTLAGKHNDSNKEDIELLSDKPNGFPAPVPISSRKDDSDLVKK